MGGGGLGFSGLTGTALAVDTWKSARDPSNNFVGITTGGVNDALTFASTSTAVGPLRTGTHTFTVTVTADGRTVLDQAVQLPPSVLVAFTGATGGTTHQHTISNVAITTASTTASPTASRWQGSNLVTAAHHVPLRRAVNTYREWAALQQSSTRLL